MRKVFARGVHTLKRAVATAFGKPHCDRVTGAHKVKQAQVATVLGVRLCDNQVVFVDLVLTYFFDDTIRP
jgi:hypothetical protein